MTIDRTTMLGIARAERERLGRTIQYAPPDTWDADSVCAGWRNRDLVAHLAAQETAAAQLLNGDPAVEFDAFRDANSGELWVSGFNEWAITVRADASSRDLVTSWGRAADALLILASRLSEERWRTDRAAWVAGDIGVRYLIQSRIIEWWYHGEDIRDGAALGPNLQHWPIHLANDLGIRMLPYALGLAGLAYVGKSIQVDLEGMGGGSWHWGLEPSESPPEDKKPDAFVQGRALAFALVAGRRMPASAYLDDGNLVVGGDEGIALAVLEHVRAFVE